LAWSELVNVLESLTEAFCTLDNDWRFTYVNAEAERYLQRERGKLLGRSLWTECPPLRGVEYETQARIAVEQSLPYAFELYDTARHLLEDLSGDEREAAVHAEQVAEKVLRVFEAPFHLGPHELHTSTSVGVALFDWRIAQADEVLKRGDLAMYQAKGAGRNTVRFFDRRMQTIIDSRVRMESDMRSGLQRGEFCQLYQRQSDDTGRTVGAESLLRWMHPDGSLIARTILGLGQTLGLDVIAEGVETRSQRDFLAAHGCRSYQGYLFGPPVTAEHF
jgi:predicted signal transduction protein with EAL and GGDEF domain